jgi:HD-like signal output (HDOD) protein
VSIGLRETGRESDVPAAIAARWAALDVDLARRIVEGRLELPLLPAVAATVLTLVDDPDVDAASLAEAIRNDQSLAAYVMKYANSPLMRGSTPLVSLQQAISRLGIRRVAEVALAACLGPKLFKAPRHASLIETLWRESLATAIWAREIARVLRRNVEVSFLCGLMQEIGRPVVVQAVQDTATNGAPADDADGHALSALLDRHAVAAGLTVAERWHLPEAVVQTIAHARDFAAAPHSVDLVATVAAARAFALATLADGAPDADALCALDALAHLNVYRSDVVTLLEQVDAVRATLAAIAL